MPVAAPASAGKGQQNGQAMSPDANDVAAIWRVNRLGVRGLTRFRRGPPSRRCTPRSRPRRPKRKRCSAPAGRRRALPHNQGGASSRARRGRALACWWPRRARAQLDWDDARRAPKRTLRETTWSASTRRRRCRLPPVAPHATAVVADAVASRLASAIFGLGSTKARTTAKCLGECTPELAGGNMSVLASSLKPESASSRTAPFQPAPASDVLQSRNNFW